MVKTGVDAPRPGRFAGLAGRWHWIVLGLVAAYSAGYVAWLMVGAPGDRTFLADVLSLPVEFAAVGLAVAAGFRAPAGSRTRRAWLLLGLSYGAYLAGDLTWFCYENLLQSTPFPSLADVGYLGFYPLALVGLLLISHPLRDRAQMRNFVIDAGMVVSAGAIIIWFVVLGPAVRAGSSDPLSGLLTLAYPVGDLVVLLGVTSAALRQPDRRSRRPLDLLILGFLAMVLGDVLYGYLAANGTYESGSPLDVTWALAWLFMAAGAAAQLAERHTVAAIPRASTTQDLMTGRRVALLASAAMVSPVVLIVANARGDVSDVPILVVGWVVGVGLAAARALGMASDMRRQESQIQLLADNARDVLFRLRLTAPIALEYVSPAITTLTGYRPDELCADPRLALSVLHPEEIARLEALQHDLSMPVDQARLRFVHRDGRIVWTEQQGTVRRQADGSVVLEGIVRDVTAQREAEEALRQSEERFRSVLSGAPVATLAADTDGIVVLLAGQALEAAGLDPTRDVGRPVDDVFATAPGIAADVRRALAGESFAASHVLAGTAFEGRYAPLHDSGDRVAGAILVATDISERVQAERAQALLSSVVEQTTDMVVVIDMQGQVVFANNAFTLLTGIDVADANGQPAIQLFGVDDDSATLSEVTEAMTAGSTWSGLLQVAHRDGSMRDVEMLAMPVRDEAGHIRSFVAMGRDVTRERELEVRLEHAQKMEAVGRLAGGLAHDFNNLLTAVSGYAQLLDESLERHDARRDDVREIIKASERATTLTKQLLAFGRRQVLRPQAIDLRSLIEDVERLLGRLLGDDVTLRTSLDADLGLVQADRGQLEQVLVNLAVNARDAMPRGGTLTIEASNGTLDDRLGPTGDGGSRRPAIRLVVSDTGVGMDGDTLSRLFEPFFTTKEPGRGTGLGLATVYGIVAQSGGAITVESEPGHGSRFIMLLPRADATALSTELHQPIPAEARQDGSGSILVVEDDSAVRTLMTGALRRSGYRVLEAPDPETALALICEDRARVDLLVSDVVMPGMAGPALAARLEAELPELRTLFVSGYPREALGSGNVVDASVAFLQKPFSPRELVEMVGGLMN